MVNAKKSRFQGPGDKVPFLSQLDEVADPKWQERYCGIVSLYMVLAYWQQRAGREARSFQEVCNYGFHIGGYQPDAGWVHTKLAEVARRYGCDAVVRSWFVRENDLAIMRNQGRLSTSGETNIYAGQVIQEFATTLNAQLAAGVPVILSVKPYFGENGDNHLIVVTAIARDGSTVKINDPQTHRKQAGQVVPLHKLLKYTNFNAIFIYGRPSSRIQDD